MIPFDEEIAAGIAAGELCPSVLRHGDPCGRPICTTHGIGLCQFHSEEVLGLPHEGDEDGKLLAPPPKPCTICGIRHITNRLTKRCHVCNRSLKRLLIRQRFAKATDVADGFIVGDI